MWVRLCSFPKAIMRVLRDQAWGGVVGIITILTILGGWLALPSSAPARAGIAASITGSTPTATVPLLGPVVPTATAVIPTATIVVPSPTAPAGFDSLVSYGSDTTLTPNWRFDCNGCDQPFLVTVTKVSINVAAQNMVWSLSVYNHTAETVQAEFFSLRLADPDNVFHDATGPIMHQIANVTAGQTLQAQVTFSFVPKHGGTYSLTASLYNGIQSPTAYGPQSVAF